LIRCDVPFKLKFMTASLNFTLYSGTRRFPWQENDVSGLSKLCGQFLGSNYSIDIIRTAEEPRRAFRDGVIESPTVFLELPCGRKHKIGGFVATEKYLRLNHNAVDEIRVGESGAVPGPALGVSSEAPCERPQMGCFPTGPDRLASATIISMLPKCVKLATLVFFLTHSIQVFGACRGFPCGVMPHLVFPSPATKEPAFALHVLLKSYSPVKRDATELSPASKAEFSDMALSSRFQSGTNAAAGSGDSLAERWRQFTLEISPAASLPPLLTWLRGCHLDQDQDGGLYFPLQRGASRLALAYSDIFETRGDPDKGGHGISILFRCDFGMNAKALRSIR